MTTTKKRTAPIAADIKAARKLLDELANLRLEKRQKEKDIDMLNRQVASLMRENRGLRERMKTKESKPKPKAKTNG